MTHVHPLKVSWGDCDPANIVYTGRLTGLALEAINAWWEAQLDGDGWFQMELDRNIGTPFVRLEMEFMHPVTPRHTLECHVWPVKLGTTSIAFRVDGEQNDRLCFSFRSINVFTQADSFEKRTPPEQIRQVVERCLPAKRVDSADTGGQQAG